MKLDDFVTTSPSLSFRCTAVYVYQFVNTIVFVLQVNFGISQGRGTRLFMHVAE